MLLFSVEHLSVFLSASCTGWESRPAATASPYSGVTAGRMRWFMFHEADKGLAEYATNWARGQDMWVTLLARDFGQVS